MSVTSPPMSEVRDLPPVAYKVAHRREPPLLGDTANPKPCRVLISRDVRGLAQHLGMKEGPPNRRDPRFPPRLSWLTISLVLLFFLRHHTRLALLLAPRFGSLGEPSVPYKFLTVPYKSSADHSTPLAPFSIYRTKY
ncbi:hypothetical protein P171DRAFT_485218 [Karstenula rhodostoma CBS 690.94]|uniref:Uncharacterized protein n=1 Tax=Karstenula rhodostoma CBS 690.94 TaxID=1392251 RepID=A0A9P4PJL0_9PLEO|nr:hypothetical protein P171DRAFT_485218 [Karstenula rhodostoma CBS 690.94]